MRRSRLLLAGIVVCGLVAPVAARADVDSARSKGAAWLIQQQRGDGSLATASGVLSVQATSATILALKNAGLANSVFFGAAKAWLANADADSVDSISRKIEGLSAAGMSATSQSEADRLFNMRRLSLSATWGGYGSSGLDFLDTALGLTALRLGDAGYDAKVTANASSNNAIVNAVCDLVTARISVASGRQAWPVTRAATNQSAGQGRPSAIATALVMNELRGLQQRTGSLSITCSATSYSLATVLSEAQAWLLDQQNVDYGFGEQRTDGTKGVSNVLATAWVYRALNNQASPPQPQTGNAQAWLLAQQNPNGSWRGDPLVSANVIAVLPPAIGAQLVDTDRDGVTDVVAQQLGNNLSVADIRNLLVQPSLSVPGTTASSFIASARVGQSFAYSNPVSGSSYSISGGSFPPGLCMDPASGQISGTPQLAGSYSFDYRVSGIDTFIGRIDVADAQPNKLIWNLSNGMNLLGNGSTTPFNVATLFGNTNQVISVWKWIYYIGNWAFYAPSLSPAELASYVASRGYQVLTTINGGEGFWVNATAPFSVQMDVTTMVSSSAFQTAQSGWNMIATGDNPTPSDFNKAIGSIPPTSGDIPLNLVTLWVWDAVQRKYFFYAPSLEQNGSLAAYDRDHGYLVFGSCSGTYLTPWTGIWLNK